MQQLKFSLLILVSSLYLQISYAEVYRWKDSQGNIHFSDKPHDNATQLDIKVPKSSGIGISKKQLQRRKELLESFQEKNEKQQKQHKKDKKQRDDLDKYCTRLRNQLKNYEEADYLFSRDKSGQKKNLSDQQKKNSENRLRKEIAERC